MHVVRDGQRELEFDGVLLSSSSSQRYGSPRWVEFELYRTVGGQYILSRTGWSTCYHLATCDVVSRNRIELTDRSNLSELATPCRDCRPEAHDGLIAPEQPRYWAQVSETPSGVVSSLYKYDDDGTRYLTHVAKRLLSDASREDSAIRNIYLRERVV